MKAKCIHQQVLTTKQFFLLMIAPLLIGLMIALPSLAHAEWNQAGDPLLLQSPKNQGWMQMESHEKTATLLKAQKEPIKRAARS